MQKSIATEMNFFCLRLDLTNSKSMLENYRPAGMGGGTGLLRQRHHDPQARSRHRHANAYFDGKPHQPERKRDQHRQGTSKLSEQEYNFWASKHYRRTSWLLNWYSNVQYGRTPELESGQGRYFSTSAAENFRGSVG